MLSLVPEVATLLARYDDGEDALHLRFRLEDGARWTARPGQFFMLSIPGLGEAAFTFVSLPDEGGCFTALVRQVGKLTDALRDLPLGTFVGVRGPVGQPWPELADKTVLVVAGAAASRRCQRGWRNVWRPDKRIAPPYCTAPAAGKAASCRKNVKPGAWRVCR